MKPIPRFLAVVCCLAVVVAVSCKKEKETAKKTTCASTLHGITAPVSSMYVTGVYGCSHGTINTSTSAIATAGSFSGSVAFTQGATFNSSNNCYYIFGATGASPSYTHILYKIDASGAATAYTVPDTFGYSSLIYNNVNNKLYCIRSNSVSSSLAEITTGSSSFSATNVASLTHTCISITLNRSSGDIYLSTGDSLGYYVEKYHSGSAGTTVIATGSAGMPGITELRFNPNDNMLYGLKLNADTVTWDFTKVNPSSGVITSVINLGSIINVDMYSATLDACANRYIISTRTGAVTSAFDLYQVNMSGAIVQHDATTSLYQGLDVQY